LHRGRRPHSHGDRDGVTVHGRCGDSSPPPSPWRLIAGAKEAAGRYAPPNGEAAAANLGSLRSAVPADYPAEQRYGRVYLGPQTQASAFWKPRSITVRGCKTPTGSSDGSWGSSIGCRIRTVRRPASIQ
ncbi:MAG: hypothetical protein LBE07_09335, partial [Gordonia sp. (in: high G+C Gram-positive bacteria)]|nr:hypothetical protein [Gordonia sp. (in: high G+C Gram-positive bacteria)]